MRGRGLRRGRACWVLATSRAGQARLLPSSSSSEVMDLERRVRAVVGARFGGGGAEGADRRGGVRPWPQGRPPHLPGRGGPEPRVGTPAGVPLWSHEGDVSVGSTRAEMGQDQAGRSGGTSSLTKTPVPLHSSPKHTWSSGASRLWGHSGISARACRGEPGPCPLHLLGTNRAEDSSSLSGVGLSSVAPWPSPWLRGCRPCCLAGLGWVSPSPLTPSLPSAALGSLLQAALPGCAACSPPSPGRRLLAGWVGGVCARVLGEMLKCCRSSHGPPAPSCSLPWEGGCASPFHRPGPAEHSPGLGPPLPCGSAGSPPLPSGSGWFPSGGGRRWGPRRLSGGPAPLGRAPGTFLPGCVVRVEAPGDRHHLEDQVIPALADHVHHLPVADLDHVLTVDLQGRGGVSERRLQGNRRGPRARRARSRGLGLGRQLSRSQRPCVT